MNCGIGLRYISLQWLDTSLRYVRIVEAILYQLTLCPVHLVNRSSFIYADHLSISDKHRMAVGLRHTERQISSKSHAVR